MRHLLKKQDVLFLVLLFLASTWGCKKDFTTSSPESVPATHHPVSLQEAKDWFANRPVVSSFGEEDDKIIVPVDPAWEKAWVSQAQSGREIVVIPLQRDSLIKEVYINQANVVLLVSKDSMSNVGGQLLMYHADSAYFATHSNTLSLRDFSGEFMFFDLDYNFQYGFITENGVPANRIDTVTVNEESKAELEERVDPTVDCILHYTMTTRCKTPRPVVFTGEDCTTWIHMYIDCETIGDGGGPSGGGSGNGGGGWGGGGGGGNPITPGGGGTLPPSFTNVLFNDIPGDTGLFTGPLPPGFTPELMEQLEQFYLNNGLTQEGYYHLMKNPNLIPLLLNFCIEFPIDNSIAASNHNDPHFSISEGQYCDALKRIVFTSQLNEVQTKWLTGNLHLFPVLVNFLNNVDPTGLGQVQNVINFSIKSGLTLSTTKFQYLLNHVDVTFQFNTWLNDFDVRQADKNLMDRILDYKTNYPEQDLIAAQNFLATEIENVLQEHGMTLPDNVDDWTPDYWEILWEIVLAIAPELVPGLDTFIEFRDAIQAANDGNWWQSSVSLAGAILTLTPWDKIKDSYKFAKAIGRASRWFDLIKRCSFFDVEKALGLRRVLKKELDNPHIFRYADGHLPALNSAIDAAGGADELLFDVYKKIHDDGLASNLAVGAARAVNFTLHGSNMKATIIRIFDSSTGTTRLEVSNFWIPQ